MSKAEETNDEQETGAPLDTDNATRDVFRQVRQNPQEWAVFLDIDGTLLDMALTPDAITVPPSLPGDLAALSTRLGGGMALVTGRALSYADRLFEPYRFHLAGLHGAEVRGPDGKYAVGGDHPKIRGAEARTRAGDRGHAGCIGRRQGRRRRRPLPAGARL